MRKAGCGLAFKKLFILVRRWCAQTLKKLLPAFLYNQVSCWILFFTGKTVLHLIRSDLGSLPQPQLPAGYTWSPLQQGKESDYISVMQKSLNSEADAGWFYKTFTAEPIYDPQNLIVVYHAGNPVAAAAAWQLIWRGKKFGLVHMVGVIREYQRKGLGRSIVLLAVQRLKDLGFTEVIIGTKQSRIPAVCLYLSLGLQPLYMHVTEKICWSRILKKTAKHTRTTVHKDF